MSGRYTRYRRTNNYPYRRGVSRGRTTVSGRSSANIRNAFQQKDKTEVVINAKQQMSCIINGRSGVLNVFDALLHSEFFNNYAPMYDQVKLDKVKAKFTALSWAGNQNNNNYTVYTAFDRNGLDEGQINVNNNKTLISSNITDDIITYSSALSKNLNGGSPFEIIRYISPSSIQEKSQYIATDSLRTWYQVYDSNNVQYSNEANHENIKNVDSKNPCYLEKNESIPFKPTYMIGCQGVFGNNGVCIFNVELDICVTFRGLRKSRTM